MRKRVMVGAALVGLLLAASVATSSAAAVELPEFGVETRFTGTDGKMKLNLTGGETKCNSGTNSFSPSSKRLGTFTIDFKECSLGGKECHSEGDAEGIVLIAGEYHLVRIKAGDAGVWFLLTTVKLTCKFLSLKEELKGNVLGLITPIGTKTTRFTININVIEGKQETTEFENDGGEKVKASLEANTNGGSFKQTTIEVAENKLTSEKETEIVHGGGGEIKASLRPIVWSGGGECPLKEGQVHFAALSKWCEYELKNENATEEIKIDSSEVNLKSMECAEKLCVGFIKGVEAGQTECGTGLKLAAGKACRIRIEYQHKPASKALIGYRHGLESLPSGTEFAVEKFQVVE